MPAQVRPWVTVVGGAWSCHTAVVVDSLWTHSFEARWLGSLTFLDRRTELARRLEDMVGLVVTDVTEAGIQGQLSTSCEVEFTASSIHVAEHKGSLGDRVPLLLAEVERVLTPSFFAANVQLQYLVPMDAPFPAAAAGATRSWLSPALPGALRDCAILVDGGDDGVGGTYQAEFGIVPAEDAAARLFRRVGRMQGSRTKTVFGSHGLRRRRQGEHPEVGLFCDLSWWSREPESLKAGLLDAGWAFSQRCSEFSTKFVESLQVGTTSVSVDVDGTEVVS